MGALKETTIDIYYDTNPLIEFSMSNITFVQVDKNILLIYLHFECVQGFVSGWRMRMKIAASFFKRKQIS